MPALLTKEGEESMSKPLNGRLEVLSLIASRGPAEIVYGGQGWVRPNKWISNDIIRDFTERGLIECSQNQATITSKGAKVLAEREKK